jgi:hypothetical protein
MLSFLCFDGHVELISDRKIITAPPFSKHFPWINTWRRIRLV